jgi:hypothetical protein
MSFKFGVGRAVRLDTSYSTAQPVNALFRFRELLLKGRRASPGRHPVQPRYPAVASPMPQRHPLLYDVERWRQWRVRLLGLATVCFLPALVIRNGSSGNATLIEIYSLLGAFLYALALMFFLRSRFSYMTVDGDEVVIRVAVSGRQRIPLGEVRRARLAKLSSVFDKPPLLRLLPRPHARWLPREALVLRIEGEAVDLVRLRRLLGPRCVIGRDLVVPVVDGPGLLGDIEARIAPQRPAAGTGRRRGRRR